MIQAGSEEPCSFCFQVMYLLKFLENEESRIIPNRAKDSLQRNYCAALFHLLVRLNDYIIEDYLCFQALWEIRLVGGACTGIQKESKMMRMCQQILHPAVPPPLTAVFTVPGCCSYITDDISTVLIYLRFFSGAAKKQYSDGLSQGALLQREVWLQMFIFLRREKDFR